MQINGKLTIVDSVAKIEKEILKAYEAEVKLLFRKSVYKIQADIINLMIEALYQSPEILSLQSGKLKADFGLDFDPTEVIIYAIANSTTVQLNNFKFGGSTAENVLTINIQPEDFRNVLNLREASILTEKGSALPWLEWLLTAGDSIIITNYHVSYVPNPSSRSGSAIMIPKGVFKVDSSFSGTIQNNFITRAIDSHQEQIIEIVGRNL